MRSATLAQLGLVGIAAIGAVLLARPEKVPTALAPPLRSAVSQAPDREPAGAESGDNAESAGAEAEAAEEPVRGRALTRQELETGLLKVRSRALACKNEGPPAVVVVRLVIAPSGAVTSVILPAEVRGTRAGECIGHAMHGASFPSWTAPPVPSVEWSYPLRFDVAD